MQITQKLTDKNFTSGRSNNPIKYIILHTMAGYINNLASWFSDSKASVSAHYGIGMSGIIEQYVLDGNTAWQAGNWIVNQTSIGIEHEDLAKPDDASRTLALYNSSAWLVAKLCRQYNIPCKLVNSDANFMPLESGILKHKQVAIHGTSCPDGLNCELIVSMASKLLQE